MDIHHLTTGALDGARLVIGDDERRALLGRVGEAFHGELLAYCLMDTHLHLVLEGWEEDLLERARLAMRGHTLQVNARRGRAGRLLRGSPCLQPAVRGAELGRLIRYVHRNPAKAEPPLVERPLDFAWSSQRELAGVSCVELANVERLRELLGRRADRFTGYVPTLADLEPSPYPAVRPELLLGAVAEAYRVDPRRVLGSDRARKIRASRRTLVHLGILEAYRHRQLATFLGRTRSRVTQMAGEPVPELPLRVARTYLREAGLRARVEVRAALIDEATRLGSSCG